MKTTQKILIVGLVLMVLLNLCTLGYIFLKARPPFPGGPEERHRLGRLLSERLRLTAEQEVVFHTIREEHDKARNVYREKLDNLRREQLELLKEVSYDTIKSARLTKEMLQVHQMIIEEQVAHFRAIRAICTPRQLSHFESFVDMLGERRSFGPGEPFDGNHFRTPRP